MNGQIVTLLIFLECAAGIIEYPTYETHPCKRDCSNTEPMECFYELHYEVMFTMEPNCMNCTSGNPKDCYNPTCLVGDGSRQLAMVYNRMLPGPTLEVCQHDRIIVDLHNQMSDIATTIHWHGLHQLMTPYMDGVPYVTQCPVQPGQTFRYNFTATEAGTHWYHVHIGMQRITGGYGALIVRQGKDADRNKDMYDYDLSEHIISVYEWMTELPEVSFLKHNRLRIMDFPYSTILVNGFGVTDTNGVPPKRFPVKQGNRYRFRLIHGGGEVCPIAMQVQNHKMTVISTDGKDIEPVTVDSLLISPGERLDIVIEANQDVKWYEMLFTGLINCNGVTGKAYLNYENSTELAVEEIPKEKGHPQYGMIFNCINTAINNSDCISYLHVRSLDKINPLLAQEPAKTVYLSLDSYYVGLPVYQGLDNGTMITSAINNITFTFPSTPMIQSWNDSDGCNAMNPKNCIPNTPLCQCTHVIDIPLNSTVEFVLIDTGLVPNISHPMHIHGVDFAVVGMEYLSDVTALRSIYNMDQNGLIKRNFENPVVKDTVVVPDAGYTVIRFVANNPGFWIVHCHVERHSEMGMDFVIKVGDVADMIAPPERFPKCGNYLG